MTTLRTRLVILAALLVTVAVTAVVAARAAKEGRARMFGEYAGGSR